MEATRVIKTIKTNVLHELDKYIGKTVEIIIITDNEKKEALSQKRSSLKGFYGACPTIGDGMEIQKKLRSEWDD